MKENALSPISGIAVPFVLGLVVIVIVYAVLNGKQIPLIQSPRSALIALLVVGMTMCAAGGLKEVGASGHWTSPLAILGILLGIGILVIEIAALAGWKLPIIESELQAVVAVAVLIAVKFVLGTVGMLMHWL